MTAPVARAAAPLSPSSHSEAREPRSPKATGDSRLYNQMDWGANALAAPTTPGKRLPVVDKTKVDPATLKAAEGMEAMFLDYMMKVMRQSVPKNEMDLDSPATEIYRGMMDSETAQKAARAGGVGLADQIVAYLESQRYNLPQGQNKDMSSAAGKSIANRTGGTHESDPVGK